MTTFNYYQQESGKTAFYPDRGGPLGISYCGLKLSGETGEVTQHIGKCLRDDDGRITPERKEKLKKELGDVLWYLQQICTELDLSLEEVAEYNLAKLKSRQARGVLGGSGDDR